jgi:hypothetical protein
MNDLASSKCKLRDIRAFEAEQIEPDRWRVSYYYVSASGFATSFDKELAIYGPGNLPLVDDYVCTRCETGLFGWMDVVAHVSDFDDEDDDGVNDEDNLSWQFGFR